MADLTNIFNPKSIAIIGASNEENSVGYGLFHNIKESKYDGKLYPVNIKRDNIQGVKAYKSIIDIKDNIDLALIATPAMTVPGIMHECGKKNVKGVVIISSGFLENGEEGKKLWKELLEVINKYDITVIGPNCMGYINPIINLNSSFSKISPSSGKIAVVSQSGALGSSILDWTSLKKIGLSFFISLGSMIDISFNEVFDYLAKDKNTSSVVVYMESIINSKKFLDSALNLSKKKPVFVLKSGKSAFGIKAALSHTGSLAGDDMVFQKAFDRTGLVRLNTIEEMFDCMNILSYNKLPNDNRLLILTNAGGPGVISSDFLALNNGELSTVSKNTIDKLNKILPFSWSHSNPVDILGDADVNRYKESLEICMSEKEADAILVLLTPQSMTDSDNIAKEIIKLEKKSNKPILVSFVGGSSIEKANNLFKETTVPMFESPERAIKSFILISEYFKKIKNSSNRTIQSYKTIDKPKNKIILESLNKKEYVLDSLKSKRFLEEYGLSVGKYGISKSVEESLKISEKIGYPVAMKIISKDIIHKTDVGGVKLNIKDSVEAKKAFEDIMDSVKKKVKNAIIEGILIEKMNNKKYELLIGVKKDAIFGHVIVFGSGGIYANYYKDIALEILPIDDRSSEELIKNTKIYELLKGYRGEKSVNISEIKTIILKLSKIIEENQVIKELDINPYAIDETGGIILDCKVIISE